MGKPHYKVENLQTGEVEVSPWKSLGHPVEDSLVAYLEAKESEIEVVTIYVEKGGK